MVAGMEEETVAGEWVEAAKEAETVVGVTVVAAKAVVMVAAARVVAAMAAGTAAAVKVAAATVEGMVVVTVAAVTAAVTVELHSPHQHSIVLRGSHHPHHKNTAPRCPHSQPRGSSLLLVEARKSTASQWKALDR